MTNRPLGPVHFFAVVLVAAACGPIGPLSGGRLSGDVAPVPEAWPALTAVENAQLETNPAGDPHSINIWIVSVDGAAFVSTSLILGPEDPKERTWVQNVGSDARVRLRAGDSVYEAQLVELDDAATRERVLAAFTAKYGELSPERAPTAWIYRVVSR